jgi:phage portal protein BeeE
MKGIMKTLNELGGVSPVEAIGRESIQTLHDSKFS